MLNELPPPVVLRDGSTGCNPIIEIPDEWLVDLRRRVADAAGFADREIVAMQYSVSGMLFVAPLTEICIMVSNIKGSHK